MVWEKMKKYVLWFANEHHDFKFQEIQSIASLLNVRINWGSRSDERPFWIVELEDDEAAKQLASRSVTIRYVIELWAQSNDTISLHKALRALPESFFSSYCKADVSFKVKVELFGSSQTQEEKVARIESFSYLPLPGPVRLKNPDLSLQYIEYYDRNPSQASEFYFGRIVAEGQRDVISKLSLKKRKFIGNTSMDPQLSLIMANQAQIQSNSIVFDPFVGSGSLLVAAAHFGGYVLGADIDFLMLHGKTRPTRKQDRNKPRLDESVWNNMKQYGLSERYIDVIVADSSRALWTDNFTLDAIVTDPPYGVREAVERLGTLKSDSVISEQHLKTHIPSKIQYSMKQMLSDLLSFSAKHLKLGGRLVTWIPIIRAEYKDEDLPKHECLELLSNSEQVLSTTSSRRLLTYSKFKEFQEDMSMVFDGHEEETFRQKYQKHVDQLRQIRNARTSQKID